MSLTSKAYAKSPVVRPYCALTSKSLLQTNRILLYPLDLTVTTVNKDFEAEPFTAFPLIPRGAVEP